MATATKEKTKGIAASNSFSVIGKVRSVDSKTQVTIEFNSPSLVPPIAGGKVTVHSRGEYGTDLVTDIYLVEQV